MKLKLIFLFITALIINTSAEKLLLLKMGPTWPTALKNTEKPTAWDASIQTGSVIDHRVALGVAFDFLWNNDAKENRLEEGVYSVEVLQRTFMFPVQGIVQVTPLPDLIVQPCISGSIGLNTMYFSFKGDNSNQKYKIDGNGWYMGLIWKVAVDAILRLGDQSGFFAGAEYQWSKPRKLGENDDDLYIRRNMSGFGLRFGFRFVL